MLDQLLIIQQDLEAMPAQDKLEELILYGRNLKDDPALRIEENKVPGCISEAYIATTYVDGKIQYKGFADAFTVRGYVHILTQALSGMTPQEIIDSEPIILDFLEKTNIRANLLPSRANSFGNIYTFMKEQAKKQKGEPDA
jgi:cysteine desulfuration protein SufE